jgi:hypothetical protein
MKTKIHKNLVAYGEETWSVSLRKEKYVVSLSEQSAEKNI